MGRFRVYPSKNSVIFSGDTDRNVGINEVLELWYGVSGATRAILKWDWTDYSAEFTNTTAPAITASSITSVKAVINCTYSILQSGSSVGLADYEMEFPSVSAATQLPDFDEGFGYHHEGRGLILTGITNWFSATSVLAWPTAGAAPGSAAWTAITSATRDAESISFHPNDTANTLAHLWSGHIVPSSFFINVLKYTDAYEALTGNATQKRLFYSRNTHTALKPYIQIDWNDQVTEHRTQVIEGVTNPLYLFVYSAGTLADPASVDSVLINGVSSTGAGLPSISKVSRGIYRYDYVLPSGSGGTGTVTSDVWSITYTGTLTGTITQTFTGVSIGNSTLWSGDTALRAQPFNVSLPNLENNYKKTDYIYVRVKFRKEFATTYEIVKNAEFRVHIPNGDTGEPQLLMYDWSPVSYRDENFFLMQLAWFITGQTYQVDVRYGDGHLKIQDTTQRRFTVSE